MPREATLLPLTDVILSKLALLWTIFYKENVVQDILGGEIFYLCEISSAQKFGDSITFFLYFIKQQKT